MGKDIEKMDLSCPRCNGTMEYNKIKSELFCPYCRHRIVVKEEENLEELLLKEKKLSYARADGRNLAEEKAMKRRKMQNTLDKLRKVFIIFICIFAFIAIPRSITYFSKPNIDDPFEYITVTFSGITGNGQAIINKSGEKSSNITYKLSKERELQEGETITITATSDIYRFNKNSKSIKVQGLNNYLFSLNDLNNEMREFIHSKSYDFLKNRLEKSFSFRGEIVSLEPYKMYLSTNNINKNILYDVYSAKIKAKTETIYEKFVIAGYENTIIVNEDNDLIRFSGLNLIGRTIVGGSNINSRDYIGVITGFENINDLETYIYNNTDTSMKTQTE